MPQNIEASKVSLDQTPPPNSPLIKTLDVILSKPAAALTFSPIIIGICSHFTESPLPDEVLNVFGAIAFHAVITIFYQTGRELQKDEIQRKLDAS